MASSLPASIFSFAVCVIGVAQGLSLVHLKADRLSSFASSVDLVSQSSPPGKQEVMAMLENINSSLDKVSEAIAGANSTAYSMADDFLQFIATMQHSLAVLSVSAAAANVTGSEDMAAQASKFIDTANATLQKAYDKVPSMLDTVSAKLATIMEQPTTLADKVTSKFVDALNIISGDICNQSALAPSMYKTEGQSRKVRGAHKSRRAHQHARKHGHKTEGVALLEHRVFQDRRAFIASDVEGAFFPKKSKSTPTGKATTDITQANSTLEKLSDKIAEINTTVATVLSVPLDVAFGALDAINATIAPALADLPGSLAEAVSAALSTLLSQKEALGSGVQTKVSEVSVAIQDAVVALEDVVPLAETLQAAVDEECGESGAADAGAAEGNSTADADAAENDGAPDAGAAVSNSTADEGATQSDDTAETDTAEADTAGSDGTATK